MKMKKPFAIGIIFLFIGVAVAPSINSTVVKTSDDLVEVTSQACGIKGSGNATVKLTKEQCKNLEQYLVDFRARLNQTTTREETSHLNQDHSPITRRDPTQQLQFKGRIALDSTCNTTIPRQL